MARTTTKKTARRPVSKARREAAQARDAEILAKAAEALADPKIGERIAALVATPRMLRYSLRNQALLIQQADERGMTLTDVDTYRGWQSRGRHVRAGEHGLKINRPRGRTGQKVDESGEAIILDGKERSEEEAESVRFRTMTVFDVSQTDGVEDLDDVDAEPAEDTEPAGTLFESLVTQAERAGYTVTVWPADEEHVKSAPVEVDHEAETINVYDDADDAPQTLSELAGTVAAILTARTEARKQARAEADNAADVETGEITLTVA